MSVSMGNFVRYLKAKIAHLPPTVSEEEVSSTSPFRDCCCPTPASVKVKDDPSMWWLSNWILGSTGQGDDFTGDQRF